MRSADHGSHTSDVVSDSGCERLLNCASVVSRKRAFSPKKFCDYGLFGGFQTFLRRSFFKNPENQKRLDEFQSSAKGSGHDYRVRRWVDVVSLCVSPWSNWLKGEVATATVAVVTSELHVVFLAQLAFPWKIPGEIGLNPSCLMRFPRHSWFSCWHMKSIQGGYPKTLGREANTPWSFVIRRAFRFRIYQKLGVPNMDDLDGPKLMPGIPSHCRGICVCRRCSWKIRRTKNFWFEQMSHQCVPPRQNLLVQHLGGWRPCPMSPAVAWRPASLNHVRPLFVLFWS